MRTLKKQFQKNMVVLSIFLISAIAFAQNAINNDKLSYHSFSLTPLEVFLTDNDGGLAITGELSFSYRKNIFTFSASSGETLAFFGKGDAFQQLNLLYGREFKLKKWFFIDTHAGIGLFFYNHNHSGGNHISEIGIPIVTKLRFKTGDKFSIGLKFQANINSFENIYSAGLLLQWNNL